MLRRMWLLAVVLAAGMACFTPMATAATTPPLLGNWNFTSGSGADQTGNWSTFTLHGDAHFSNGLVVSGTGNGENAATGWASASGYSGPAIADKTLVSWVKLDSTAVTSGSPLSLYKPEPAEQDVFDAIDYAEQQPNQWMAGSDFFRRYQPFVPGSVDDAGPDVVRQLAISYQSNGNGTETITGCLNGALLGSYTTGNVATFAPTEQLQALFGPRHEFEVDGGAPVGSIDAHILASRIYGGAMSCGQVAALRKSTSPMLQFDAHAYGVRASSGGRTVGPTAPADLNCTIGLGNHSGHSAGTTTSVSGIRSSDWQQAKATSTLSGAQAGITTSGTITATATAAAFGNGGITSASGTTTFTGVSVEGRKLPSEPAPNTTIHLRDGTLVLNEQTAVTGSRGDSVGVTVNAIDATIGKVHAVIGHATASLTPQDVRC